MSKAGQLPDSASLLAGVRKGDSLAMARAITAIENQTVIGCELGLAVQGARANCRTLGVTGPPGAGKSTLINALLDQLLPKYRRVGVLTVDPSSPVSGGAVLGDRVRMAAHSANPDVFIRSLASRGHLGGVTRTTRAVIDLLAAGGMELVIVETVGTGQSEVEVAQLTDVKIVVCAPGLGDEMQAIKAGVLEIADLLVVNKSDLPGAEQTSAELRAMLLHRGHDERRRALQVSSTAREGLAALADAIDAFFAALGDARPPEASNHASPRAVLAENMAELVAAWVRDESDQRIEAIAEQIAAGKVSSLEGAQAGLRVLIERSALAGGIVPH